MARSLQVSKHVIALDCPDADALAAFYARLLGWEPQRWDSDWVALAPPAGESGVEFGFQTIQNYRAPEWPEGDIPQQAHVDFYVESIEESAAIAEAAGATRHAVQPSENGSFMVFLDPVGHPFCLCRA